TKGGGVLNSSSCQTALRERFALLWPAVVERPRMQSLHPSNSRRGSTARAAAPCGFLSRTEPPCPRFSLTAGNGRPNPGIASHKRADRNPVSVRGRGRYAPFRHSDSFITGEGGNPTVDGSPMTIS